MKCKACGFKDKDEIFKDNEEGEIIVSKEEFETIQGNFTIEESWSRPRKVYLMACPLCGTVRMEKGF